MKPEQSHTLGDIQTRTITISKDDYNQLVEERDAFQFEAQQARQDAENLRAECARLRKAVADRIIDIESVLKKADEAGLLEKFPRMQAIYQGYQAHDVPVGLPTMSPSGIGDKTTGD